MDRLKKLNLFILGDLSVNRFFCIAASSLIAVATSTSFCCTAQADEPVSDGDWSVKRDNQLGIMITTMELVVTPMAEPRPALKHHLIPDDFDLQEGNAAIYYLRAMGFLEQNSARELLSEYLKKARKAADEKGDDSNNVPPYSWLDMPQKELPIEDVKKYLQMLSFQPRDLAEAARRRSFSMDRNLRQEPNPVGVLLPDIQTMRELARNQSFRCRVAIAEGRCDDAIAILGQQYAMAKHLGTDEFLVSNLVGAAVAGIAFGDALQLCQMPATPNLYWAFATLPNPMIDFRKSIAYERQFLFEQVKVLREVDEQPRNAGYWQDFIDRLLPQMGGLDMIGGVSNSKDSDTFRATVVAAIATGYPGARRYLIEDLGMDPNKVESYTTAQTFFLAVKRFYEQTRDDHSKWHSIPYAQAIASSQYTSLKNRMDTDSQRIGWASIPTEMFLASFDAIYSAQQRMQQTIALLQTVEAIRMYGAGSEGKLPNSLESLPVPAPVDPLTGKPFQYELNEGKAILTGHRVPGLQYRLVIRFAK
jgi:hypothetical protein